MSINILIGKSFLLGDNEPHFPVREKDVIVMMMMTMLVAGCLKSYCIVNSHCLFIFFVSPRCFWTQTGMVMQSK